MLFKSNITTPDTSTFSKTQTMSDDKVLQMCMIAKEQLEKLQTAHRYSKKILATKRCDHCQKAMLFVGLRCKDCRFKCHRKCAKVTDHRCQHVYRALEAATASASQRLRPCRALLVEDKQFVAEDRTNDCMFAMPRSPRQAFISMQDNCSRHRDISDDTVAVLNDSVCTDDVFIDSGIHTPLNLNLRDRESRSSYSSSYCSCPRSSIASDTANQCCLCETANCMCGDGHQSSPRCVPASNKHLQSVSSSCRQRNLSGTMSCPPKMRNTSKLHLCSTWPSFKAVESSSGEIYDWQVESQAVQYESEDIHSKLDEWKINYDDIEFNQCLKRGKNTAIYRGRWHGDVVIHTYHSSRDVNEFLEEVAILSRIRHENIELFMGVSTEPSKLAVVTSVHKGPSLFEHLHLKGEKMSVASKIHIARQIAQGVGYLHAMGITVGSKLNSRNIFLESKVKICLLGFDFVEVQNTRDDIACLPSGYLSYMAPELLRTVRVESSELVTDMQYNTTTDIFAFGTILYELFSGSWPFDGENSYALIWSLCNGDMPSLSNVDSPGQIKNIINECWSEHPLDRPLITEVVKELQHNVPLHKKHSQSEPDQLNRLSSPTHLRSPWR